MKLTNAGNYPVIKTKMVVARSQAATETIMKTCNQCIPRGSGNSISDSALNDRLVLSSAGFDKIISFDNSTGILVIESGVTLADIASSFSSTGWFLPTTPGTNLVTVGGSVAGDVHGKNHHVAGSFGDHVLWLDVLTAEKGLVRCSPEQYDDLFYATIGGHGLTGFIVNIAIQMVQVPSMWIKQTGVKAKCLEEILDACDNYSSSPYTVAWIDPRAQGRALGRGCLMCGAFALPDELGTKVHKKTVKKIPLSNTKIPVYFPVPLLNRKMWVNLVNMMYARKAKNGIYNNIISYKAFFFPLQTIDLMMFGGGHITYQFVIPYSAREGFCKIFKHIVESQQGSLISVLKLFGPQRHHPGNISFPIEGYNLGIDFKVSEAMFRLFKELDAMVLDYGGRHYLAKDVCLTPESIRRGYGKSLDEFLEIKAKWDPKNQFRSLQSLRLKLY